jgi:hypothetical protein
MIAHIVRKSSFRILGATALLALAFGIPAQQAAAQDPLLGGILGGAAGAIIGGAAGGGRGAAIGAIIGGTTGAIIGSEGQRRRGGYTWWRNGCYGQRGDGAWFHVSPGYCRAPAAVYAPPPPPVYAAPPPGYYPPPPPPGYAQSPGDPIAYCMQRYRSYDPASQTYLGYDGYRHPCP